MILLGSFYDEFSVSESSLIRQFPDFIDKAVSYFHHEPIENTIWANCYKFTKVTTTFRNVFLRGNIIEEQIIGKLTLRSGHKKTKNKKHFTFSKSSTVAEKKG